MIARPCIDCGEPSPQSRCQQHRAKDTRRRKGKGEAAYDPVWRKLSTQARRASPWCESCGSVENLTCDHIIPKSIAPELVHSIENIAVRCRPCNSRRGVKFADADARAVLTRLQATHNRRPTRGARERINAAQRALQTRGDAPCPTPHTPTGEAKFQILSSAAGSEGSPSGVAGS